MCEGERGKALQVLQSVLCRDDARSVAVWLLDESEDSKPLCRQWLRRASCAWGKGCCHSHKMNLARFGLRATRGASMPAIFEADAKSVCYGLPGPPVAFVLFGDQAVYDFENPNVADSFLHGEVQNAPQQLRISGETSVINLKTDLLVQILLDSGVCSAMLATATCRQWRESTAAERLRERVYEMITGTGLVGCSGKELGNVAWTCRLFQPLSLLRPHSICKHFPSGSSPCLKKSSASCPGECVALLMDGMSAFSVIRSGEVRCYHLVSGQLLDTCHARRLGKNNGMTCACILGGEVLMLGDAAGGLTMLLRNDFSEANLIRQSSQSAVASLVALGEKSALLAQASGAVELLSIADYSLQSWQPQNISSLCVIHYGSSVPALTTSKTASEHIALFCSAPCCICFWDCSRLQNHVVPNKVCSDSSSNVTNADGALAGHCSLLDVFDESQDGSSLIVSCSTLQSTLYWWEIKDGGVCFLELTNTPHSLGGIASLACSAGIVVASHTDGSLVLWRSAFREPILHLQCQIEGPCLVAMSANYTAFAQTSELKSRGSKHTSLELLCLRDAPREVVEAQADGTKREKKAKMFAHKSRGGRKNFASKQTGRQTSLCKCTR